MTEDERAYIRRIQEAADHVIICWQLERDAETFTEAMESFVENLCSVVNEVNVGAELFCGQREKK